MINNSEIYEILNNLGLDEDEIKSINRRNKLLDETIVDEVSGVVDFFSIKCNLKEDDIARIIIKNPLILNESFERINTLSEIYKKIGFDGEEYKKYIVNYDKAFSLNPKELIEGITNLMNEGKNLEEIRSIMVEKASRIF